jgi:low affinity Fe/Cu permease
MGLFFHRPLLHRLGRTGDPVGEKALSPQGKTAVTRFSVFALHVSDLCARPMTLVASFLVVMVWAVSGFFFHWSDTWQLVINTGTTIVTFLLSFVIRNAQKVSSAKHEARLDRVLALMEEQLEKRS